MLQEVPKPQIVPTLAQQNPDTELEDYQEVEEPEPENEGEDEMTFDELPSHAKQLILQQVNVQLFPILKPSGHGQTNILRTLQFRNRNPTHPFNRGRGGYSRGHNRGSLSASPTLSTEAALPTEKRKSWSHQLMMLVV